ncbi:54S ribosomal protein L22 [Mactra antiquata]
MTVACSVSLRHLTGFLSRCQRLTCIAIPRQGFHASSVKYDKLYDPSLEFKPFYDVKTDWIDNNNVVYAPTEEDEAPRPAEIYHQLHTLPVTPKKLWYPAFLVRGLSIDEAIRQCEFNKTLGATFVKKALIEAQDMAVRNFHIEFRSNLWVADSFCSEHFRIIVPRRRSRGRAEGNKMLYSYYFLRLREGKPPKEYYPKEPSGNKKLEEYVKEQRNRRIIHSL